MSPDFVTADAISELVPDGTLLHREIATEPGGCRVASGLPGSATGSRMIAHHLAVAEEQGAAPAGFCARLLARLQEPRPDGGDNGPAR